MQLHEIALNTRMEIQLIPQGASGEGWAVIYGTFLGVVEGLPDSFYVSCGEIYERFHQIKDKYYMRITFFHKTEPFVIDGVMTDAMVKDVDNLVIVVSRSMVEKIDRRGAARVKAGIPTKIYEIDENAENKCGKLVAEGLTYDMSISGVSFLSNERLNLHRNNYTVEFSLFPPEVFHLPIRYVRSADNPRSDKFNFDYAFMFTSEYSSDCVARLTKALFRFKMDE